MTKSQTTPYLQEILRSDPFARFLRLNRVSPLLFGSLVFLYSVIRTLVLPAAFGHLFTVELEGRAILGALDDWPVLVIEMVMVPVVAGYYLWQPNTMQKLYDGISEKIGPNPLSRAKAMEYVRPVRWSGWAAVAVVIGLFEALYIQYVFQRDDVLIWETVNSTMAVSYILIRFMIFYMLVYIIVRQVFMIIGVNRLFLEVPVTITPLHPDKAGGLRILGDYVLSIALVIGAVGLYFGMGFIRQGLNPYVITTEFYVLLTIYFFLAPLFFFLPLIQVHRRMKEAKRKLLLEVADQFDIEYRKLLTGLKNDQMESNQVQRVEALQKIYKIAEDAPEWPLNFEILSKFSAATVLPVLIPLGVEFLRELFTR
jgi:hypothetical protein